MEVNLLSNEHSIPGGSCALGLRGGGLRGTTRCVAKSMSRNDFVIIISRLNFIDGMLTLENRR